MNKNNDLEIAVSVFNHYDNKEREEFIMKMIDTFDDEEKVKLIAKINDENIAIRYKYKPYFYVKNVVHDVRIVAQSDPMTGDIVMKKAPVQAMVQADILFLDNRSHQDEDNAMQEPPRGNNTGLR